eukprot:12422604-Karenia_brevis.AAC.1
MADKLCRSMHGDIDFDFFAEQGIDHVLSDVLSNKRFPNCKSNDSLDYSGGEVGWRGDGRDTGFGKALDNHGNPLGVNPIQFSTFCHVVAGLNKGKVAAGCGTTAELYQALPFSWLLRIHATIGAIILGREIPRSWSCPKASLIPKSSKPVGVEEFRMVVTDVLLMKMLLGCLFELSYQDLEKAFWATNLRMFCGMKGVQASEFLFILKRIQEMSIRWSDWPVVTFIKADFEKAFDKIFPVSIAKMWIDIGIDSR